MHLIESHYKTIYNREFSKIITSTVTLHMEQDQTQNFRNILRKTRQSLGLRTPENEILRKQHGPTEFSQQAQHVVRYIFDHDQIHFIQIQVGLTNMSIRWIIFQKCIPLLQVPAIIAHVYLRIV